MINEIGPFRGILGGSNACGNTHPTLTTTTRKGGASAMATPESTASEEWRPVVGYEGLYEVSNLGRVRSLESANRRRRGSVMMRGWIDPWRYHLVELTKDGSARAHRVHRLVLAAFVGPRPDGYVCGHLDGVSTNNVVSNLKWITPAENAAHRDMHGTTAHGERLNVSHLTADMVREIRARHEAGESYRSLAKAYGVCSKEHVYGICKRKYWVRVM
jgi:hypothetical protein